MDDNQLKAINKLREPFEPHQISKLPKPTKAQTDEVKQDFKKGIRCDDCGGWHHPKVVHLDYVGHAALTDRLLDADPFWSWEPLALDQRGLPLLDENKGMWIKLTVSGITRLGYGSADGKTGPDSVKELIGDALRNAAMRFGAALELWHKGQLHLADENPEKEQHKGASEILAKAKAEIKEAATPQNIDASPADYFVKTGKHSGKALKNIPRDELETTIKNIKANIATMDKRLVKDALELASIAQAYLDSLPKTEVVEAEMIEEVFNI